MNEDHHEQLYHAIRKWIPPPNPIINKQFIELPPPQNTAVEQANSDQAEQQWQGQADSLQAMYSRRSPVFEKWPQRESTRNGTVFFASAFLERTGRDPLHPLGQAVTEGGMVFDSCYQGGNLLAAYRVGEAEFDLLLQNDLNSGGYTQWFDFTLKNGKQLGTVKLNIVNLYKRLSLFGQGLKPLTRSQGEKGWKRGCHSVEYFAGELRMEGRKAKKYRILSFKYDFIREDDSVRFCYCLPYSHSQLVAFLGGIDSPKARVKYLGATSLGKLMPMLKLSSGESEQQKKAIVLLGRQHAGETPSSHIIQALISELLTASPQNDFLLSHYSFYIFPMVNIDGVTLGNYRCNFHGVDLNRVWQSQDSRRHPQVCLVKAQLRRIMRKEEVELLIDMHGHSNKMNSFFYANSFGKHNMILPAVAARTTSYVDLSECSLSEEEADRASTARVALGSMIRETGSAYTFQVSLFGGVKQGKKVAFSIEHYHEIARGLLGALWKMGTELQKEERLLKESLYLRDIRREIRRFENRMNREVVSDQQAKKTSQIQEKLSLPVQRVGSRPTGQKNRQKEKERHRFHIITKEQQAQTQIEFDAQDYKDTTQNQPQKKLLPQAHKKRLSFSIRKVAAGDQTSRKLELMSKLRVFGQTFTQELPFGQLPPLLPSFAATAAQTLLTYRISRKGALSSNRGSFIATNFVGRRLGEPSLRRRERIYKSNSSRATNAEVSFSDLIRHNKLSLY